MGNQQFQLAHNFFIVSFNPPSIYALAQCFVRIIWKELPKNVVFLRKFGEVASNYWALKGHERDLE